MPSPIAHSATSFFIYGAIRDKGHGGTLLLPVYFMAVANFPDLDLIPQVLTGIDLHHRYTHSIFTALALSAAFAGFGARFTAYSYANTFLITFLVYLSHLFLDFITDGGDGVQLFWPVSTGFFHSPVTVFPGVHYSRGLFDSSHLYFLSFEAFYSALLFMTFRVFSKKRKAGQTV